MTKLDSMLIAAKRRAVSYGAEEWRRIMGRMTTEQLYELVEGDPTDERIRDIFASVDGLHLIESG